MSHKFNYENDRLGDARQATGPLGLGAFGWIVIGVLIGAAILVTGGTTQAPMFALGAVGAGLGVILGTNFGRKRPSRK